MDNLYASLEQRYGLPEGALSAVESVESGGKDTAESSKGAKGRFQFMPSTAQAYGIDVSDPISSAYGAAQYLSDLQKQYGSFKAAIAHYNGGSKAGKAVSMGDEPPATETKGYLQKVSMKLPPIDPSQVEPSSSVSVSGYDPINPSEVELIEPIKAQEVTKELPANLKNLNKAELFLKGLKASGETTMTGIGQVLDPLAQQLEKAFPEFSKAASEKLGLPTAKEVGEKRFAEILAQREANKPLLETTPGMLGNVTGELGQALVLPGGTIGKAALAGAEMGAAQPTLPEESRAFNAISSGALGATGQGIVSALGKVAQPITAQLSGAAQNAVKVLTEAGIPLDAAQKTGSALLARAKTVLDSNPFTAGFEQKSIAEQQSAFNKAILKTVGADSDAATSNVMRDASKSINDKFENILSNNNVALTDDIVKRIADIQISASDAEKKPIVNLANRIIKNVDENGAITGQNAYSIYKDLNRYASNADSELAYQARQLRSTLLDGINNSLNDVDRAALTKARTQFRNMKLIESTIDKEGAGDISPSKLANVLGQKANRQSSIYGRGDQELVNLAQAGNMLLKSKIPDSGTVKRAAAWLVPDLLGSAAYGAYTGDYKGAAEAGLVGIAAPYAMQKALRTSVVQNYLTQGIKNTAIRDLLQAPSNLGAGKIPLASFESYLQQVQKEKGNQ